MKKLTIVVPDDFDAGSVISLIGRDLIMAHIGEYRPPVPTGAKPNGVLPTIPESLPVTVTEPDIETGRIVAPYSHTPGHTRQATTRNRLPKMTLRSLIEDFGRKQEWFTPREVEDLVRTFGYKEDSGYKALSTMKCNELVEWDRTSNKYRLLRSTSLVEF